MPQIGARGHGKFRNLACGDTTGSNGTKKGRIEFACFLNLLWEGVRKGGVVLCMCGAFR